MSRTCRAIIVTLLVVFVCSGQQNAAWQFDRVELNLPGRNGLVTLDYIAYDAVTNSLWVPAGNTASVDVIDGATNEIKRIQGFPVKEIELHGKQRKMGPSSIAIGDGVVYVGSRADSKICVINTQTLKVGDCILFAPPSAGLAAAPDGLVYVAAVKELWATRGAPPMGIPAADRSIKVFSASNAEHPVASTKIPLGASAEGYAVDNVHGRFYTNLEETGQTIAIDVHEHKVVSTWESCNDPSGVAVDTRRQLVFVACTNHVMVLDSVHDGHVLESIPTGTGLDNIDYDQDLHLLYAAAASGHLAVARIGEGGTHSQISLVPTQEGARSVVAGRKCSYVIDPYGGRILKFELKTDPQ